MLFLDHGGVTTVTSTVHRLGRGRSELTDLRQTTRALMQQMEKSTLGTKLDWIAVDHHNTGHPHTHILVRGVIEDGKTLNIAGDYIAYGIRERASEIVTLELGRQTELEITKQLEREVDADRFTPGWTGC